MGWHMLRRSLKTFVILCTSMSVWNYFRNAFLTSISYGHHFTFHLSHFHICYSFNIFWGTKDPYGNGKFNGLEWVLAYFSQLFGVEPLAINVLYIKCLYHMIWLRLVNINNVVEYSCIFKTYDNNLIL